METRPNFFMKTNPLPVHLFSDVRTACVGALGSGFALERRLALTGMNRGNPLGAPRGAAEALRRKKNLT